MAMNTSTEKSPMTLDPITLEIIIARLQELVSTMEHLLFHSGYSTILRESHDGSCTLLDTEGNCIEGSGGPLGSAAASADCAVLALTEVPSKRAARATQDALAWLQARPLGAVVVSYRS